MSIDIEYVEEIVELKPHAQGREWVLPKIFTPFETEYDLGLECGSMWGEWMNSRTTTSLNHDRR